MTELVWLSAHVAGSVPGLANCGFAWEGVRSIECGTVDVLTEQDELELVLLGHWKVVD